MSNFRFSDGVEFDRHDRNGNVAIRVSIPLDDDGYLGRQCPQCDQIFRMRHEDDDRLPDDLVLWCVYCGHTDGPSEFVTEQQLARGLSAAGDYGVQLMGQMLDKVFKGQARQSKQSALTISYRSKPFYPRPLPGIDEEKLVRERECGPCGTGYAVFGEHRFCPVCGPLRPLVVAEDALSADLARLNLLTELPPSVVAELRERGGLDRTYADIIKNLVGVVESLAETVFRADVQDPDQILRGKGNVFQRLDEAADLFSTHLDIDLRRSMAGDWPVLLQLWAARHVMVHNDGIVDDKYLESVPATRLRLGQRLRITEAQARAGIGLVRALTLAISEADSA